MNNFCQKCGTSCTLARDTTDSGSIQVFWWCVHCWDYSGHEPRFIAHEYIKHTLKISIESLTPIERYPQNQKPRCVVCGKVGAQLHHFGPRHLFGPDCEKWPTGYLCDEHHTEWHSKVTPNMMKRLNGTGVKNAEPSKAK